MVKVGEFYRLLGLDPPWNIVKVDDVDSVRAHVIRPYEAINMHGDAVFGKEEWYVMLDGDGNMHTHVFQKVEEDDFLKEVDGWRGKNKEKP